MAHIRSLYTKKRKPWNGKWENTLAGRRELLVQYTTMLNELEQFTERVRFMQALTQKAVAALARVNSPEGEK